LRALRVYLRRFYNSNLVIGGCGKSFFTVNMPFIIQK
jgi:hypothetical protein